MKTIKKRIVAFLCVICALVSDFGGLGYNALGIGFNVDDLEQDGKDAETTVLDGDGVETGMGTEALSWEDGAYKVTAFYDAAAGIPDGASLAVRALSPEDENYADFIKSAEEALDWMPGTILAADFLDVSVVKDGERILPRSDLVVRVERAAETDAALALAEPSVVGFTWTEDAADATDGAGNPAESGGESWWNPGGIWDNSGFDWWGGADDGTEVEEYEAKALDTEYAQTEKSGAAYAVEFAVPTQEAVGAGGAPEADPDPGFWWDVFGLFDDNGQDGQRQEAPAPYSAQIFAVVQKVLETTITASDGLTYDISVEFDGTSGIPENAVLEVGEIPDGHWQYDYYADLAAEAAGATDSAATYTRVFDISITDPATGEHLEPNDGGEVKVSVRLADLEIAPDAQIDVVHFAINPEGWLGPNLVESSVNGENIEFLADSFSVYVIVAHEGDTKIENARVEFHFIDKDFSAMDGGGYTASPYNFINKGRTNQTTQILKDTESLEQITNPSSYKVVDYKKTADTSIAAGKTYYSRDSGTGAYSAVGSPSADALGTYYEKDDIEKFFYGWYVVELNGSDTTNYNASTDRWTGAIPYVWTDDPEEIHFEEAMTLTAADGSSLTAGTSEIKWSIGGVSRTGVLDAEGKVHVYLAPMYEDFYFLNFRMGPWEEEGGSMDALQNSLLTRRLIVFGADQSATVLISDVLCPSPDPKHKVFVGWQEYGKLASSYYATVDSSGKEVPQRFFISITKVEGQLSYDLYPLFTEARWLNYTTGQTGNGATYVPSQYLLTNDQNTGTMVSALPTSQKNGYVFGGWYVNATMDSEGNIANLTPTENKIVTINEADYTYYPAIRLTDGTGTFLSDVKGKVFYAKQSEINAHVVRTYMANSMPEGDDYVKLFEITSGSEPKLYVYTGMDDLTLTARWTANDQTTYKVIVWKQKVTDHKDAAETDKTYDFETVFTSNDISSSTTANLVTGFSGSYSYTVENNETTTIQTRNVLNLNLTDQATMNAQTGLAGDFTGFHYARTDYAVDILEPDGTTTYNVYYDRDVVMMKFYFETPSGYNDPIYALTSPQYSIITTDRGLQYALVDGEYIPLVLTLVPGYLYQTKYSYTRSNNNNNNNDLQKYGIQNSEIIPIYYQNGGWKLANGSQYTGNRYTRSDSNAVYTGTRYVKNNGTNSFSITSNETGTLYGQYSLNNTTYYEELTVSETTTAVWTLNGEPYSGTRYTLSYLFYDGLYGQSIAFNGYSWPSGTWSYFNNSNGTTGMSYLGDFVLPNGVYDSSGREIRLYYTGSSNVSNILFALQNLDEGYSDVPSDAAIVSGSRSFYFSEKYNGYHIAEYRRYYTEGDKKVYLDVGGNVVSNGDDAWATAAVGESTSLRQFVVTGNSNDYYWTYSGGGETLYYTDTRYTGTLKTSYEYANAIYTYSGSNSYRIRQNEYRYYYVLDNPLETDETGGTQYAAIFFSNGRIGYVELTQNSGGKYVQCDLEIRYARNRFNFTFDVNYPEGADIKYGGKTLAEGGVRSSNVTKTLLYEAPLADFGSSTSGGVTTWYFGVDDADNDFSAHKLIAPDHYIFKGWFEDPGGKRPFNFDSTMPAANKIVYACWEPETFWIQIDPNGAEIDHINHIGQYSAFGIFEQFRPSNQPTLRQATYIEADYGETVGEYALSRNYVPISDAAAETYDGQLYYYFNFQLSSTDGASGLYTDMRSALYLKVAGAGQSDETEGAELTHAQRSELQQLYALYKAIVNYQTDAVARPEIAAQNEGMTLLDYDTWTKKYLAHQDPTNLNSDFQLYREKNSNETYEFLGWFEVTTDREGNEAVAAMPYVFTTPVTGPVTLRALWRLDGGYKVQYHADYSMSDGALINGTMTAWFDPQVGQTLMSYADGAQTTVFKQPYDITINGTPTTEYIFRGFRKVTVSSNDGSYTAMEPGVYYSPGDDMEIIAADADTNGYIHLQAVYELKDQAYRRPDITNLTLDANGGYLTTGSTATVKGNKLDYNKDLTDALDWKGIGTVAATKTYTDDSNVSHSVDWIEFGDIQSSQTIRLYRLATTLTNMGDGNPDGTNYFAHPDNYLLLGFDDDQIVGNYVADYPADSIIAVTRNDPKTLYAVWEPMVYLNFVNNTDKTVTFSLGSDDGALTIVNGKDGLYGRTAMTAAQLDAIDIQSGETLMFAVPKGAEKTVTVTVKNELGIGKVLTWDTSLTVNGTSYNTANASGPVSYPHAEGDSHVLAKGQVNNTMTKSFDEKLIVNPDGITVTFDDTENDYALVLESNFPGGGYQEYDYSLTKITAKPSQLLPSTSTRPGGYQFLGWAYKADATEADFSSTKPDDHWTIADLHEFFYNNDAVQKEEIITGDPENEKSHTLVVARLYAVWTINDKGSTVYIYKDVPLPGNQNMPFAFTLKIEGRYYKSGGNETNQPINVSQNFYLAHTDYAVLESENHTDTANIKTVITVYTSDGAIKKDPFGDDMVYTLEWSGTATEGASFEDLDIRVTETAATYYTTSVSRTAHTPEQPLFVGDASDQTTIPLTQDVNTVHWDNTFAGGTVVFTNTREKYDITVKKDLTSYVTAPSMFSFRYSYILDGDTAHPVTGNFSVTSGTPNTTALKDMPAGAVLTITETNDGSYVTKMSSKQGATDEDATDAYGFTFTVTQADEITFDNTLKSYPVRFIKVDQDMQPTVNATFSLTGPTGSLGSDLYASSLADGVFYSNSKLWVGEYSLTETITPSGYVGLSGAVTIDVTGDDANPITCTDNHVKIEKDSDSGVYSIYVINQRIVTMTIRKILSDPLLTSGTKTFNFTVTYDYTLNGTNISESETVSTESSNRVIGTGTFKVPVGSKLTVTEALSPTDSSAFDTVYNVTNGSEVRVSGSGTEYTAANPVAANDGGNVLTFTNTKKTVEVTLKKTVTAEDKTGTFSFTATLIGNSPIKDYPIEYTIPPGANSQITSTCDSTKATTNSNGEITYTLRADDSIVFKVPVGLWLTVQEMEVSGTTDPATSLEDYSTTATATNTQGGANYDAGSIRWDAANLQFTVTRVPSTALTITFTNGAGGKDVYFKKIDGFGNALAGGQFSLYSDYACTNRVQVTVGNSKVDYAESTGTSFLTAIDGTEYNVTFKIPNGIYYMKEVNTVTGYEINTHVYRVTVGTAEATVTEGSISVSLPAGKEFLIQRMSNATTIDNVPDIATYGIMNISQTTRRVILKKSNDSFAPLEGAKFDILYYDRTVVPDGRDVESTSSGVFWIGDLPFGKYYLEEKTAPNGYTGKNYWLTVNQNGVAIVVANE